MEIVGGGGSGAGMSTAITEAVAAAAMAGLLFLLAGAVTAAAAGDGGAAVAVVPCFHACFDQCVQREEFWFCQFSCYRRCGAGAAFAFAAGLFGDCEHACVLSMCGQIDPDSKMMAVCRDTCGKSYAVSGCRRPTSLSAAA